MKKLFLSFILLGLLFSCDDKIEICEVSQDNLPGWLDPVIADIEQSGVSESFFISTTFVSGKQVVMTRNCCPNCGTVQNVYSCDGELLGQIGDEYDADIVNNEIVVWQPENFSCQ